MNETNEHRRTAWVVDLGPIPYGLACDLQHELVLRRKEEVIPDLLLVCEHPHVITLGRNGKREHLRAGDNVLRQMQVEFRSTDRGGDITYHGPGQIIGYPILDLAHHRRDVRWYVERLEEVMICASGSFGVLAKRLEAAHGAWIDAPGGEEKLGALGVRLSRWVTSHGFAYNVSTDLRYFDLIVPCGIPDKRATSLERLLGKTISIEEVKPRLIEHFGEVFGLTMVQVSRRDLQKALANGAVRTGVPREVGVEVSVSRESVL